MGARQITNQRGQQPNAAEAFFYRKLLLEKRRGVTRALAAKAGTFARFDRIADEDQAQYSHEEFVSLRLNRMDYEQLRQVEEALDRLESGDFGICQACGEPIPAKRLQAVPWAKYCVPCQQRLADTPYREPIRLVLEEEAPC